MEPTEKAKKIARETLGLSDDDLKRLKGRMKDADVPASHVKLLLARLEAAEKFVESSTGAYPWLKETIAGTTGQRFDEWRKACGR